MIFTEPAVKRAVSPVKRRLAIISRWIHIYLSMASFGILLFFAVTGLTLNHAEWFDGKPQLAKHTGTLNPKWLQGEVAKLEIVEALRRVDGAHGALSDFRVEDSQCTVSFKGPGYTADAFIDRASGKYELTETRMGFVAVINDLHKGRDTGKVWSWMIDASALLMTFVSLTGFVLLFFLHKRRLNSGLVVAVMGAIAAWAVYRIFAP